MGKEEFKQFVRNNPKLSTYVNDGKMTWQKFYEMYDMYGEKSDVWNEYLKSAVGVGGFLTWLKTIDLNEIQTGVNSLQRVVGVFQDLTVKDKKSEYKPRPKYKNFDD